MKKKILIGAGMIVLLLGINAVAVFAKGVSPSYWCKLGFPNAVKVWLYESDEYPGHSLECMRFPESLMENESDQSVLEYTEKGTGIDCNGYHVHIGDTREEVKEQFTYIDSENDGTSYELGCYFCDTGYMLDLSFEYDETDHLVDMKITKNCYA